MSQVSIGPPVAIDGALPAAPLYSLLSTATVVDDQDEHWGVGAQVFPYPPDLPSSFDPCSEGTFREKDAGTAPAIPIFGAFTAYLPITCSSLSAHGDWFQERARAAFNATQSYAIAAELSQGIANPLAYDPVTRKLAAYDAEDPLRKILFDVNGNLCEGMGSNIFIVRDGEVVTPREKFVLPGVSRQTVIDLAHNFGRYVVAFGIEKAAGAVALVSMG